MEYSTKTINLKRRSGSLVIHVLHASNPVAQRRLHIICVSFQVNELFYRSLTFAMEKFTRILFVVVPAIKMLGWLGESLSNQIVAWNSLGKTRAFVIIQIIFVGEATDLIIAEWRAGDIQSDRGCMLFNGICSSWPAGIKKAKRQQVSIVGNASKSRRPCCELLYYYDCRNSSSIRRCCLRGSKAQAKVGGWIQWVVGGWHGSLAGRHCFLRQQQLNNNTLRR